ncbi:hypothetical protein M409DRAFT_56578 [Zasmidium cellare ATCC 36951]|uniref:Xylanolytic transcriptional activator regulatory domain-containing protein n=1 Tax=Zasmidium cellare ATCC 36951 TaxID=1080233 RepID=A0A6A6CAU4_ZASCE|nr:uncharacterized protein M409DRAFT_56578 [Zasmidium cellare ATCC 36951]KAF2164294.1 hypothetical protein M409DRAFT_56578 [Zasmidium cellare ATCC 36951]
MGLDAPFYYVMPEALGNQQIFNESYQDIEPSIIRANWSSKLPTGDPESVHELKRIPCFWTVTQGQHDNIEAELQPYRPALSEFVLPSALALSRYLGGYMEDFQDHQAIIHTATYRLQEASGHPELMLAVCACRALTRYERRSAIRLFRASKVVIDIRNSRNGMTAFNRRQQDTQVQTDDASVAECDLRIAQAAMLLSTFAIMEGKHELINDATSLNYILIDFVRKYGTATSSDSHEHSASWRDWALEESRRRTQCAIFNILNMHTMALDSAPGLLSSLLDCFLPCSTPEWTASTEHDWLNARKFAPEVVSFQQAYAALFDTSEPHSCTHSPLGNLTLISAILQRIYHARQLQVSSIETLRDSDLEEIEIALDRWTHAWKQAPESILDPRNPDASNSFTSTSYLGLAYVRLHATYGARRRLCDWQPRTAGASLYQAPLPQRAPRMEPALLHAAQALATPVKFGIEYMGRKQFHYWDLQNFIWHLEAAVFLSKWFLGFAETCQYNPPSDFELRLISSVTNLVDKGEESIDPGLLPDVEMTIGQTTANIAFSLSRRSAKLWTCLYHKQNSPWGLVDMIGQSLAEYEKLMAGS